MVWIRSTNTSGSSCTGICCDERGSAHVWFIKCCITHRTYERPGRSRQASREVGITADLRRWHEERAVRGMVGTPVASDGNRSAQWRMDYAKRPGSDRWGNDA